VPANQVVNQLPSTACKCHCLSEHVITSAHPLAWAGRRTEELGSPGGGRPSEQRLGASLLEAGGCVAGHPSLEMGTRSLQMIRATLPPQPGDLLKDANFNLLLPLVGFKRSFIWRLPSLSDQTN
jgi:hypothetical protein